MDKSNTDFEEQIRNAWSHNLENRKNALDIEPMVDFLLLAHNQSLEVLKVQLLAMNLSDVAFAQGQVERLTGEPAPYWARRRETLTRHLDKLQALPSGEEK